MLLLNCVQYLEISRIPQVERPIDFGQKPYWFDFFARPVIGGVLAWVYWYIGEPIGPLVAMNIRGECATYPEGDGKDGGGGCVDQQRLTSGARARASAPWPHVRDMVFA